MSDLSTIDYRPLQRMDNAGMKVLQRSLTGYGLPILLLVVLCGVAWVPLNSPYPLVFAIVMCTRFYAKRYASFKDAVWNDFAVANSWPVQTINVTPDVVPPSLDVGHSRKCSRIIQAPLGSIDADLFMYQCTVGYGKSAQTLMFTAARVKLARTMPHIILASKAASADLQADFIDGESLQLEGDFDKYFKLQIEKGQQIDVLTLLTPDVMQTLVNYNTTENIEILNDDLYFIIAGDKRDERDVKALIQSVVELSQQIIENSTLAGNYKPISR